jgi:ribosomal protein L22
MTRSAAGAPRTTTGGSECARAATKAARVAKTKAAAVVTAVAGMPVRKR